MEWQVLADVPSEHVRDMLSISHRRTFRREEVVFHHGDPAESLHLIAKGRFAARIPTPLGRSAMVAIYGPGEAFGELALLPPAHGVRQPSRRWSQVRPTAFCGTTSSGL